MTYITDTQVEQACDVLRKAINAAENSNHAGEVFVVAAANATALVEALADLVSWFDGGPFSYGPWIMKAGGYGADDAVKAARTALTLAKGGRS